MLDLEIRDDGVGLRDGDSPWKPGVGLANSRERLAYLYGGRYQFSAANSPEGGCKISIRIPWHTYEVANDSARQESSL
jgi:LytS/YehU family sensor histidine kinase